VDTNHSPAVDPHAHAGDIPVEPDDIFFGGLIWFGVVLIGTVIFVQLAMYGLFRVLNHQITVADPRRPPLAASQGSLPPAPNLLYEKSGDEQQNEPGYLREFHAKEDAVLNGYTVNKAAGTATIPIARAKELLLQRGLPARPQGGGATTAAPVKAAPTKQEK
jgi:hypothetical protein